MLGLYQLYRYIRIRFDFSYGKLFFFPKLPIIIKDTIVGKGKGCVTCVTIKWVIIRIVLFITLRRESSVPENSSCAFRRIEMKLMRRLRAFIDDDLTVLDVAYVIQGTVEQFLRIEY